MRCRENQSRAHLAVARVLQVAARSATLPCSLARRWIPAVASLFPYDSLAYRGRGRMGTGRYCRLRYPHTDPIRAIRSAGPRQNLLKSGVQFRDEAAATRAMASG